MRSVAGLVAALVATTAALGQAGGPDSLVSPAPIGTHDVDASIALHPTQQGTIVVAFSRDRVWNSPGLGVAVSYNFGSSWNTTFLTVPGMNFYEHPAAAFDSTGLAYVGCSASNASGLNGIYLWSSTNLTAWTGPTTIQQDVWPGFSNTYPQIKVDTSATSPNLDCVYVLWERSFGTNNADACLQASTPGGTAWQPAPTFINDPNSIRMVHEPRMDIAPDGTVHVVWPEYDVTNPNQVFGFLLHDRGTGFPPTFPVWDNWLLQRTIRTLPKLFTDNTGPLTRGDTSATIAVHPNDPNQVFVAFAEDPDVFGSGDEGDIYVIDSMDGGITWSTQPYQVNLWPYNVGYQFAPWIDVKPSGRIDVAYYDGGLIDSQPPNPQTIWNAVLAASTDGGATWIIAGVGDWWSQGPAEPPGAPLSLGCYLAMETQSNWAYMAFSSTGLGGTTADTSGNIYFDRVNNATYDDANGNGIPDFVDIWQGTSTDANGDGVPDNADDPLDYLLEFSLDIGSDSELSDPQVDGDEGFDPGDVYWGMPGIRVSPPGRDGFKDDATIFGFDPWPDPPDPNLATVVPVGTPGTQNYANYFDLDGHDQTDFSLQGVQFPGQFGGWPCVFDPRYDYLIISFDDDMDTGWPNSDVPVTAPSPAGVSSYGTTGGQDEIQRANVAVSGPPPYVVLGLSPIADELTVHQSLAPNPDNGDPDDDDVDSLDAVEDSTCCPIWFFTADHEACLGLDPGSIYEVTAGGPVQVIDDVQHLGIPEDADVDAFEFVQLENPSQPGSIMFAVLFSVDNDDPLTTGVDESGGMDPTAIYVSWCAGSYMLFCPSLGDDVDALTMWWEPIFMEGACCLGAPGACVVTTEEECAEVYFGEWKGADTDCSDWDGNGLADICEDQEIGACCYGPDEVECVVTTEDECVLSFEGLWNGPGTNCDDNDGNGLADACEQGGCPSPGASGNFCTADIDGSGDCVVGLSDLAQLLANYGCPAGCTREQGDLDDDTDVDLADLAALLGQYGDDCN